MKDLIGSPLAAAADASINLANSTAEFINKVGFDDKGNVRNVTFQYEKISKNDDGTMNLDAMKVDVPMLAIVPIPNLQVDEVNILFDMEVKQSEKSERAIDLSASASAKLGIGPFSVNVSGSISVHDNNTRSSDNSAKYHVDVRAANHGIPEGLARVLDMMAANVAPSLIDSKLKDENGQDLSGEAKAKAEERKRIMNEMKSLEKKVNAAQNILDTSITSMKRNMDDQLAQYRMVLVKDPKVNFLSLKNVIQTLNDSLAIEKDESKREEINVKIAMKKAELDRVLKDENEEDDNSENILEELNLKWASAENMLAQNIKDLASDDTELKEISDILGLVGLSSDGKEIVKYESNSANKYDAILKSQNLAIQNQQKLNKLESEYMEKKEAYDQAFLS
ncbi:MAG: DUF2589 domain-containing protein [Eubacterium sp.]|nr:DUF2589 domain-containing protein [Eubacterium sp.]